MLTEGDLDAFRRADEIRQVFRHSGAIGPLQRRDRFAKAFGAGEHQIDALLHLDPRSVAGVELPTRLQEPPWQAALRTHA